MIEVRHKLDNLLAEGRVVPASVHVVGQRGVLCIVSIENIDRFTIPIPASFLYHRLDRLPLVTWTSYDIFGQPSPGLSALAEFLSTHHVIPMIPGNSIVVTKEVPKPVPMDTSQKRVSPPPADVLAPSKVGFLILKIIFITRPHVGAFSFIKIIHKRNVNVAFPRAELRLVDLLEPILMMMKTMMKKNLKINHKLAFDRKVFKLMLTLKMVIFHRQVFKLMLVPMEESLVTMKSPSTIPMDSMKTTMKRLWKFHQFIHWTLRIQKLFLKSNSSLLVANLVQWFEIENGLNAFALHLWLINPVCAVNNIAADVLMNICKLWGKHQFFIVYCYDS